MNAAGCPDAEVLGALLESDADEGSAECSEHLETCPCCQQTLADLAADGSTWQDVTRSLSGVGANAAGRPPTSEQTLQRGLAQLKAELPLLLGKGAWESGEDLPLPVLQPADRPGVLGLLGSYEVLEAIGQGGMGIVLKAFDPALKRLVAIKVPSPVLAGSAHARRRFIREARAAAAVSHEHIVPVHGVEEVDGLPYLVMQFIEGESLQDRLDRTGPLPIEEVVHIGLQTARGLAAAHAQGLIHRDVKPANLLLEGEPGASVTGASSPVSDAPGSPHVKITDFGLARMVDDVGLTQNGVLAGTPEYMAPEQARGEQIDHRADLFSLGSVLYACCTGLPPFRGESALAVLRQVSDEAPAPVRTRNPDVPAWLETVIARLMAGDPEVRFRSAAEVAALLEGYLAHLRQPGTVPPPELPPLPAEAGAGPPSSRFRGRLATWLRPRRLAALGALAALGGCLFLLLQAAPPPQKQPSVTEVSCDFRGGRPLPSSFTLEGPDAKEVIKQEEQGLRITLPATRKSGAPVGVATTFPVAGDFEITGTYELLSADRPADGNGVGVALNIATDSDLTKFGKVSRFLRAQEGDVYQTEFWIKGQPDSGEHTFTPTTARAGQLRLVREGSTLRFLVAEGPGNEFEEINRREFTTEDLPLCRFVVNNSGSPAGVDVRLIDFRIRSGPASAASIWPTPKRWLLAVVALGLILGLLSALGVLLHVRRRAGTSPAPGVPATRQGGEEKTGPADPEAAAPSIAFPCPGCGKKLRARAALAGKSVKCPGCGQGVLVPETNPAPLAPRASTDRFSILKNRGVVASVLVLAVVAGVCSWLFWPRRDTDEDKSKNLAGWGAVTDPSGDCTFTAEKSRLVVKVPGSIHNLNPNRGMQAPRVLKMVSGDFVAQIKVTGDFKPGEKAADQHSPFNSAGLLVWQDEKNYIRLERNRWYVPAEQQYACYPPLLEYYKNGEYQGADPDSTLDEFFKGRSTWLRLERKGDKVIASYSHDGKEWTEAKEITVDLPAGLSVGVAAINTSEEAFTVAFDEYKVERNAGPSKDGDIRSGPASILPKGWLAKPLVVVGFISLGLLSVLGVLLHVRRRAWILASPGVPVTGEGGEEKPGPADPQAAAPFIVLPCPGCGKVLRARAALAGKSVKCPQCGQGVLIPETNQSSLAPRAPTGRSSILKNRGVVASVLVLAVVAGVCTWLFWPRRDNYPFENATLGNQFVPEVQESGFYQQEYSKGGEPFRWTNGKGRLVIPIDRRNPPTGLVLKLQIYRPAQVNTVLVQIVANNRELTEQQVPLGEWEGTSAGKFPARVLDLTGIDLGNELVLDIISETFIPKADRRTLGVVVSGVELQY